MVYVGLTASGYELASLQEEDPMAAVAARAANLPWPKDLIAYFRQARHEECELNPYWPRAFLLVAAGLRTSESQDWDWDCSDPDDIVRAIRSLPINPIHRDNATMDWLMSLPLQFQSISSHPSSSVLWKDYLDALSPKLAQYKEAMLRASRAVSTRLGIYERQLPEMILVPNPLQAPQIADAVAVGGRVFLIIAEPEPESVVHEMLHHLMAPGLKAAEASIDRAYALWKPASDDMIRIGYAWDDSVESWRRVFEENLVRAATIWVGLRSESGAGTDGAGRCGEAQKGRIMAREQAGFGFLYVPVLLDMFLASWRGMENTDTFICDCLKACMVLCQK